MDKWKLIYINILLIVVWKIILPLKSSGLKSFASATENTS